MEKRFTIYPLVPLENGQHSISDETLIYIWNRMQEEGKIEQLFYDGTVKDIQGWLNFIKAPGNYPAIIWDSKDKKIVHIVWLNNVFDCCAWIHHCAVGPYKRGAWEAIRDYWRNFDTLKLLLGLTPISNPKAIKMLKKIAKFTILGEVPLVCKMAYSGNKREPGIFSYLEL